MKVSIRAFTGILFVLTACTKTVHTVPEPEEQNSVNASGTTMTELFEGRFPGVEVLKGASGGISIRIRGTSTVLGSNEPLYIIDGTRVQSGAGGLLFLDPHEIANIKVLKDIGETAIYGSEGANGVIIITTKRALK
jgi:TonB-dependent SusC/RagA subfamily outer membrane receptor